MNTQRKTARVNTFPGRWADLENQIAHVMERFPDLSSYGWLFTGRDQWNEEKAFQIYREEMHGESFTRQVAACLEVMGTPQPRGCPLAIRKSSSYAMKHKIEARIRKFQQSELASYITNGAFIVAAVIEGWEPVRWANNPNCTFKRRART